MSEAMNATSILSNEATAVYQYVLAKIANRGATWITLDDNFVSKHARVTLKNLPAVQSELARLQLFDMVPGTGFVRYSLPETVEAE